MKALKILLLLTVSTPASNSFSMEELTPQEIQETSLLHDFYKALTVFEPKAHELKQMNRTQLFESSASTHKDARALWKRLRADRAQSKQELNTREQEFYETARDYGSSEDKTNELLDFMKHQFKERKRNRRKVLLAIIKHLYIEKTGDEREKQHRIQAIKNCPSLPYPSSCKQKKKNIADLHCHRLREIKSLSE